MSPTKVCPDCRQEKPLEAFHFRDKAKGYRNSYCGDCVVARKRRWREENRERAREHHRLYMRKWSRARALKEQG